MLQYQIESLKKLCEQSLCQGLNVDNAASVFLWAEMHNAAELKSSAAEFIVTNSKQVMATEGWGQIMKTNRMELLAELLSAQANAKKGARQ